MKSYFPTFRRLFGLDPPLSSGGLRQFSFASFWPQYTTAAQRRGVLRLIAVAAEENVPLAPLLSAWADSERGVQVHRLRLLVRLMNKGLPLPDAIEQVRGVLSDDQVLAVRIGSQAGTLASTLRWELENSAPAVSDAAGRIRQILWYAALVAVFCLLLIDFMYVGAISSWLFPQMRGPFMPELRSILSEFSLETTWLFDLAEAFADRLVLFGATILVLFSLLGLWSHLSRKPGRLLRTYVLNPLFKPLRDIRSANMLLHLAGTIAAGRPALGAVSTLARYHYDSVVREQMLVARNDVEQGVNLWSSLVRNKVLSPADAAALGTCQPLGNEAWMLSQLATLKRARAAAWSERVAGWLLPLVVLVMGSFVLFQALAVFGTLNRLIWGLRF